MNRALLSILLALTHFAIAAVATAAPPAPPNIILIVADDMGWGDLPSYGHPIIKTPHLDRIAREGQRWTTFYSGAPYCTASRTGPSLRREYFYYRGSTLQAVRSGPYKAHFFTRVEGHDQSPQPVDPPGLYDLDRDVEERYDIAKEKPEEVARLKRLADEHRRGVVPVEDQIAPRAAVK
jgi:arylsulfatase A-like enzyme